MNAKFILLFAMPTVLLFGACKKDLSKPQVTFTNNIDSGTANASGEYTLTGHITSPVKLSVVTLSKDGDASPFLVDNSTAQNKLEYDFSYLIKSVTSNETIVMDVIDQQGVRVISEFSINKY
jgi:hypothetical protein